MRYLLVEEIISLHAKIIAQSGGSSGLRDQGALESAAAQPEMTFDGNDLYPTIVEKAAASGQKSRAELGEWLKRYVVEVSFEKQLGKQ